MQKNTKRFSETLFISAIMVSPLALSLIGAASFVNHVPEKCAFLLAYFADPAAPAVVPGRIFVSLPLWSADVALPAPPDASSSQLHYAELRARCTELIIEQLHLR